MIRIAKEVAPENNGAVRRLRGAGFARSDVERLATEVSLARHAPVLSDLAAWGARLEHSSGDAGTGRSKIGGLPDLPPRTPWPPATGPRAGLRRSLFLAQIELREVPAAVRRDEWDVESGGLVLFFAFQEASTAEVVGGAVLHVPRGLTLERHRPPVDIGYGQARGERSVALRPELTLPAWPAHDGAALRAIGIAQDARASYARLRSAVERAQNVRPPRHRLLGHPDRLHDDVLAEAVLVAGWAAGVEHYTADEVAARTVSWRTLLRIDSDDAVGFEWPGLGALYFCIPAADLRAARFERVQAFTSV